DRADVCLVFATGGALLAAHGILHAVRRATGARSVVGCSGAGVLTEAGEREEGDATESAVVAGLAITSDELRAAPFVVDETDGLGSAAGAVAGARSLEAGQGRGVAIVFPDAKGLDPAALLRGFGETGGPLPVVGGVAAGSSLFELYNTDGLEGAMTGLA